MDVTEILTITLGILGILSFIFSIFKGVTAPNKKQDEKIIKIETRLETIETNHIAHIEKDIKDINNNIKDICSDIGLIKGTISKK